MSEPITKTILVLANSIKKGGRCVAGIEITPAESNHWHLHDWIRPVDPREDEGTIPNYRVLLDDQEMKLLDCVEIPIIGHADDPFHAEDFEIDTDIEWKLVARMGSDVFDYLPDESEDLWGSASAASRAVDPKPGNKTLRLIKPSGKCYVTAYRDDTPWGVKHRRYLHILHKGITHQFSIDDPYFSERHDLSPRAVGEKHIKIDLDPAKLVIIASLTKPFKGFQYKIAASIFEL